MFCRLRLLKLSWPTSAKKILSGTRSQKESQKRIARIYAHAHLQGEYESTGGENLVALQGMYAASNSSQSSPIHHLDEVLLSSSSFPNWNKMKPSTMRSDYGYIYEDHLLHEKRDTHRLRRHDEQVRLLQADHKNGSEASSTRTVAVWAAQGTPRHQRIMESRRLRYVRYNHLPSTLSGSNSRWIGDPADSTEEWMGSHA